MSIRDDTKSRGYSWQCLYIFGIVGTLCVLHLFGDMSVTRRKRNVIMRARRNGVRRTSAILSPPAPRPAANTTCEENPFVKSLKPTKSLGMSRIGATRRNSQPEIQSCTFSCVGGDCQSGKGIKVCGLSYLKRGCIIYSLRNHGADLRIEMDLVKESPCQIHVFGGLEPSQALHNRLLFHNTSLDCTNNDICIANRARNVDLMFVDLTMNENITPENVDTSWILNHAPMQMIVRTPQTAENAQLADKLANHAFELGYALVQELRTPADLSLVRYSCPTKQTTTKSIRAVWKKSAEKTRPRPTLDNTTSTEGTTLYSPVDIMKTVKHFGGLPMKLLVFDGETDQFNAYNILPASRNAHSPKYQTRWCRRCGTLIPIMVEALRKSNPQRFQKGAPPMQLLFSTNDCISTACINHPKQCATSKFAPVISFGTVPKNPQLLPTVKAFPFHFYQMCMTRWLAPKATSRQVCKFPRKRPDNATWDDLIPQIIWRGSDYAFSRVFDKYAGLLRGTEFFKGRTALTKAQAATTLLNQWDSLIPRWRAVGLSLQAEIAANKTQIPWIDCKFVAGRSKSFNESAPLTSLVTATHMDAETMAQYRYQVDTGGVGGTSWLGTVGKLAMPGLLFHHETETMDWFYRDIKPWVHYVPIKLDLSDLKDKFKWAEQHPAKAQQISNAGTNFALSMISDRYMQKTYDTYFVKTLGNVALAFHTTSGETLDSIVNTYNSSEYLLFQFANCDKKSCTIRTRSSKAWNHSLPLGNGVFFDETKRLPFYSSVPL